MIHIHNFQMDTSKTVSTVGAAASMSLTGVTMESSSKQAEALAASEQLLRSSKQLAETSPLVKRRSLSRYESVLLHG